MLNFSPWDDVPAWKLAAAALLVILVSIPLLPVTLVGALFGQDWTLGGLMELRDYHRYRKRSQPGRAPSR